MSGDGLTPLEILALHQALHDELGAADQQRFLTTPEVAELVTLSAAAVQYGLRRTRLLTEALPIAKTVDFWFRGQPCDEDGIEWCARCKPNTTDFPATVVVSVGGTAAAFHATADCDWLVSGQRAVVHKGGTAAPLERVAVRVALTRGKYPCVACFGD